MNFALSAEVRRRAKARWKEACAAAVGKSKRKMGEERSNVGIWEGWVRILGIGGGDELDVGVVLGGLVGSLMGTDAWAWLGGAMIA